MSSPQAWIWHQQSDVDAVAEATRTLLARGYEILAEDEFPARVTAPEDLLMLIHAGDFGALGNERAARALELEKEGALWLSFSAGPGNKVMNGRPVHSLQIFSLAVALAGRASSVEPFSRYLSDEGHLTATVKLLKSVRFQCLPLDHDEVIDKDGHIAVQNDRAGWNALVGARAAELEAIARVNQAVALLNVLCWVSTGEGEHEFARAAEEIDAILPR